MTDEVTFYFDFSSSYSYLAQARCAEIEQKTAKKLKWKPVLLGGIFKALGHSVPAAQSHKMNYMLHDLQREAKAMGMGFALPETFPFNAIEPMRIFYAIDARDPLAAEQFAKAVFHRTYSDRSDVTQSSVLEEILSDLGLSYQEIVENDNFTAAKAALKHNTEVALEFGVFGAPTFVYQGELFWGADRIDALIRSISAKE